MQLEEPAVEQVDHAAGGADDDLGALLEGGNLLIDLLAANTGGDEDRAGAGEAAGLFGDLFGELAGGRHAEDLGVQAIGVDPFEGGQHERGGLAGSGAGLADSVPA